MKLFAAPVLGFTAAIALVGSSAEAAGNANGFGEKGQLIISADRLVPLFGYASASVTRTENGRELTDSTSGAGLSILLGRDLGINGGAGPANVHTLPRVAFDYSVINHLTLGAAIAFGFGLGGSIEQEQVQGNTVTTRKIDSPTSSAIGLAPRVGYVIPLGDWLAFWPRAGFAFYAVSTKFEQTTGNNAVSTVSTTDTLFALDLDPQLTITPTEHFFFHAGPLVNIPLTGSRSLQSTTGGTTTTTNADASVFHLGLVAGIGGWFSL